MQAPKILVTGGAGFIGSHTCKALSAAGFTPIAYDNLTRGNPEAVKWGPLETGDLNNHERLREVLGRHRPIAAIHFAALAYVGESNNNPTAYYRNNVGGTATLLDALREFDIHHLVFSSSCAVYGVVKTVPITEDSPLAPINPYGATKLICERMLDECATAYPLNFIALRYFNAAGADPECEIGECHVPETHVIPLLLDVAAGRRAEFIIYGNDYPTKDGTCVRDYVHVADLADAHVRSVHALLDGAQSAVLNVGGCQGWSVRELLDCAQRITRCHIPFNIGSRRPGDPPILVADATRARSLLGWRPRSSDITTVIAHAWAWRQKVDTTWERMRQQAN